ncbi:hypothetical protein J22TS3_10380 [Paenibacillus sp. J22TS3]|nr:hypothetical protein J22TS3_10380 [Paenibacillus sp. J22TS3]
MAKKAEKPAANQPSKFQVSPYPILGQVKALFQFRLTFGLPTGEDVSFLYSGANLPDLLEKSIYI